MLRISYQFLHALFIVEFVYAAKIVFICCFVLLFIWVSIGKLFLIPVFMLYYLSIFMNLLVFIPMQGCVYVGPVISE